MQAKGLSPIDVVNAMNAQNLTLPTGTAKIGSLEYNVEMNGTPGDDCRVERSAGQDRERRHDLHTGCGARARRLLAADQHRAAGRQSRGADDDLENRQGVHAGHRCRHQESRCRRAQELPQELKITPLFDQSLFVAPRLKAWCTRPVSGLPDGADDPAVSRRLAADADYLISIPLSIFVSVILLSALGETFNIMTLGGLALAVGILVDDATVEIENIERNIAQGKELKRAILDGAQQIAVPAFVSTLCICIVFVPMFFLTGVAKFLFVPLAEAVVFAMLASYLLSRTLIPTLVMYIMRGHEHRAAGPKTFLGRFQRGFEEKFENFRRGYEQLLELTLEHRNLFASLLPRVLHSVSRAGVLSWEKIFFLRWMPA